MWRRLLALIVKELLAIWRDPRSRAVVIGPPLIQLFVFGYAAGFEVRNVQLAVLNEDAGRSGRDLVASFAGAPTFTHIFPLAHAGEIAPALEQRRAQIVLRVPEQFSRDIATGRATRVQVILDGRNSNTALILDGYAAAVVEGFVRALPRDQAPARALPRIELRAWFNPNLESRWYFLPGIVALLTFVVAMALTALSVAREREIGTYEQLLITPLSPTEIMVGKSVPALLIGFAEGAAIAAVAALWFQVPLRGALWLLAVALLLFLLSSIAVGLMLSSVARTQQQAIFGAFLFVVPAVILSGFSTPIANMPDWVQTLTLINPMRYFLVVVRGVFLEDIPLAHAQHQLWPMAAIAAAALAVGVLMFRRRLG